MGIGEDELAVSRDLLSAEVRHVFWQYVRAGVGEFRRGPRSLPTGPLRWEDGRSVGVRDYSVGSAGAFTPGRLLDSAMDSQPSGTSAWAWHWVQYMTEARWALWQVVHSSSSWWAQWGL